MSDGDRPMCAGGELDVHPMSVEDIERILQESVPAAEELDESLKPLFELAEPNASLRLR